MSTPKFYQVAPTNNGGTNVIYAGTLAAAGTTLVTTGNDMIFRIVASQPITIRFGTVTNLTANGPATTTDIYIPANMPEIFDMGHLNNAVSIYALNNGTIVTLNQVSKN